MKSRKIAGAVLATAVALSFAAPVRADDSSSKPAQVRCMGANACKGQSACKTAANDCKGQNGCKGKGYVMAANADECAKQGGHVDSK